jgi:hypothetical protein
VFGRKWTDITWHYCFNGMGEGLTIAPFFHVFPQLQKANGQLGKMKYKEVSWKQVPSSCQVGFHAVLCGRHISACIHD